MKKIIVYEKLPKLGYRNVAKFVPKAKTDMQLLFDTFDLHHYWMVVEEDIHEVVIWNLWDKEDYPDEDDIPKLIIKRQNYDEIIAAKNANKKELKPYIILSQDESGWITFTAKDTLSPEDLEAIDEDNKAGEEWEKQWIRRYDEHHSKSRVRLFFEEMYEKIKNCFKRLKF